MTLHYVVLLLDLQKGQKRENLADFQVTTPNYESPLPETEILDTTTEMVLLPDESDNQYPNDPEISDYELSLQHFEHEKSNLLVSSKKLFNNLIHFHGHKQRVSLFYDQTNIFGDEISKFIINKLINKEKYKLEYNNPDCPLQIVGVGSLLHKITANGTYVFGTGSLHWSKQLDLDIADVKLTAVRGPNTLKILTKYIQNTPEINSKDIPLGDPALLVSKFYTPRIFPKLQPKLCLVPHYSHYEKFIQELGTTEAISEKLHEKIHLIDPTDPWFYVTDQIFSCRGTISSSLYGLIISDAYNKPNVLLDPVEEDSMGLDLSNATLSDALTESLLDEENGKNQEIELDTWAGHWKFDDYYDSQGRKRIWIEKLSDFDETKMYRDGNQIDLDELMAAFPFS